jgi:ElaB/YqjD/DUF883 family membrane-anchored ribosome-binding protein
MEQKNAVMKALKDWKSKLEKIQKSVTDSLEKAQDQLGSRIDQELKKTLDGTMKVMGSARSEIEEIQGVLKKMVTPAGKKASQKKKPAKKKPASLKKSVAKTAGSKKPGAESQAPASSVKAPAKKTPARKKASPAGSPSES